jgi:hypothetical protein
VTRRPTHGAILAVRRLHETLARVTSTPAPHVATPALDAALAEVDRRFPDVAERLVRKVDDMPTFTRQPRRVPPFR